MRIPLILLLASLALGAAGCSHSESYHLRLDRENRVEIDEYNCRWQLTHEKLPSGEIVDKEVDEDTLDAKVHECMVARGHYAEPEEPAEEAEESGWWPF